MSIQDNELTDPMPPVTCAPWCREGDGHPQQRFTEDQTCYGQEVRTITARGEISAGLHRPVGAATEMLISIEVENSCAEMTMSISYFREWLNSAEKAFADVFETGGTS